MKMLFFILTALTFVAIQPLHAQSIDSVSVHFGWVLRDGTIFMEFTGAYNNDKLIEAFNHRIKTAPLPPESGALMCDYKVLDTLSEIETPFRSGDRVLTLVDGTMRPGTFVGNVYVRNQVAGAYLPGGHIKLDNKKGLPKCDMNNCDFYCVPLLIFAQKDSLPAIQNVTHIEEIDDSTKVPAMLLLFINETRILPAQDTVGACQQHFFTYSDSTDNYLFEKSCPLTGLRDKTKYFQSLRMIGDGFSTYELVYADTVSSAPIFHFLDTFELNGTQYLFVTANWHDSKCMMVLQKIDNKIMPVAISNVFKK